MDAHEPLERIVTAIARQEQGLLRQALLADTDHGQCGICGRDLPAELLVAAHIKPRSVCNESEKRDIPNIAMLMCALGCDALFERGYVTVSQSLVRTHPLRSDPPDVTATLASLEGRECAYWAPERRRYFTWHARHRQRG